MMLTMQDQLAKDIEMCRNLSGLYVGQLLTDEMEAFNRLCRQGLARRKYDNLLGLAKCDVDCDLYPRAALKGGKS